MTDENDQNDALEIWLAAFQDTQRQMAEAHAAYQAAMAEGHRAFIEAIRESQRRLADVLDGKVEPAALADKLRESGIVELDQTDIETIRETIDLPSRDFESSKRFVATSVEREAPRQRLERLGDERVAVVADGMGVAAALAQAMRGEGVSCILCESDADVPDNAKAVIHLGSIHDFESTDGALSSVRDAALLVDRLDLEDGLFVSAFDNGGRFGLDANETHKAPTAGMAAITKTLAARYSGASLKWIDVDVGYREPSSVARQLFVELMEGGNQNVGLPEGARVVRMLEETEVAESSWRFDGVLLISVTKCDAVLETIRHIEEVGSPRVVFVGDNGAREAVERAAGSIEYRWISLDTDQFVEIFDALESAREEWGPVGALVHANAEVDTPLARVEESITRRLLTLQVLLAATAGDPVTRLAFLSCFESTESEAIVDEMLRKVALAERDRRADECVVKAITIDGSPVAARGFWEEWSREPDEVEVYLQRWSG